MNIRKTVAVIALAVAAGSAAPAVALEGPAVESPVAAAHELNAGPTVSTEADCLPLQIFEPAHVDPATQKWVPARCYWQL